MAHLALTPVEFHGATLTKTMASEATNRLDKLLQPQTRTVVVKS